MAAELNAICVFCGSTVGSRPEYQAAAISMGEALVAQRIRLVYGGGTVGLMGAVAKAVVKGLGPEGVVGVIPESLKPKEVRQAAHARHGGRTHGVA
jgi:predicted Rossmann-fold nucleotide-binding protein